MRHSILKALTLAASSITLSAAASAQYVGVFVGPAAPHDSSYYGEPYAPPYGPRVYGYYNRDARDRDGPQPTRLHRSFEGCGTYRYWDGERCVDARRR